MTVTNITQCEIKNSRNETIVLTPNGDYATNEAYFIVEPSSFNGLATVGVADEQFETDDTIFRMQLAKIQYAPRDIMIVGTIYTPICDDQDAAYRNRVAKLREVLHIFSARGYLALVVQLGAQPTDVYTWYCHLRGSTAIEVTNYTTHYAVTIRLYSEDPFLYAPEYPVEPDSTTKITTVTNPGDAPYYAAKIVIPGSAENPIRSYECNVGSTLIGKVGFITPIENNVMITAEVPGQTIHITGTDLANINLGPGFSAFLQIPVGESKWHASDDEGAKIGITITTRTPYAGIAP